MALPLILAAGSTIAVVASAIARWVQAIATTVSAVSQGVIAWFAAHKIIFSLVMLAVWVALWFGAINGIFKIAAWGLGFVFPPSSVNSEIKSNLGYFSDYIDFAAIKSMLAFAAAVFAGEIAIRNFLFARRVALAFVGGVSRMFHG